MKIDSKIYIAGHTGLVGNALLRACLHDGYTNIVVRTRQELDLLDQTAVANFFQEEKPEYVFLAAAKVGGIVANKTYPADFLYENLCIQNNIISNTYKTHVKKLLFLGSSCIYPKHTPQPIKEEFLLTGPLEPTNEAYAIAKIAGIKMCQAYNAQYGTTYISLMPTNLYGPHDNFNLETSHVLPALIRKFHEAKERDDDHVTLWGTGNPRREFLHVDDLASACLFLMNTYNQSDIINVGTGTDISIKELAELIRDTIGYTGRIEWDTEKPDGTPRKLLDVHTIHALGWHHTIDLVDGISSTYAWFTENN